MSSSLPDVLLLVDALPFWVSLRARPRTQAVMRGVNAAIVGLLVVWRTPPAVVVVLGAAGGLGLSLAG